MIRSGCEISTLQRLMGHQDLKTTARYLHVVQRPGLNIESPLDRLRSGCTAAGQNLVRDFQLLQQRFGVLEICVFRPKWKVQNGRSGRSVSEEVEGLLRGCGTAIPAHVARPELRRRSTLDN